MLLSLSPAAFARHDKTDVVTLDEGSTYVGEIKSATAGVLTLDTHVAGTVSIKWFRITGLESEFDYQVEVSGGQRYFGTLKRTEQPGELRIVGPSATNVVALSDIMMIVPLGRGFWKKLSGFVDAGFSYTESNRAVQFNLDGRVRYRSRKSFGSLGAQSLFNDQQDGQAARQHSLTVSIGQRLGTHWSVFELAQIQSNPDEGFDLRGVVGAGGGRYMIQGSRDQLLLLMGPVYNRESVTQSTEVDKRTEVLVGLQYVHVRSKNHSPTIISNLNTFTSVSGSSRFRLQFDFNIRWTIVSNFDFSFTIRDAYDSAPPGTNADKNNLSLTSSIGYTF